MVGRGKAASSIASTFTYLLRIWREWDVRGMVLLSLLLQIALYVFGKHRKYNVRLTRRMILWFAYISADWLAIAALAKLSSAHALSPTKNVLRALWAPILILHLGGSDTITAYTLQDTQLWTRHILTLVVQSIFAIYVIYLSWTYLRLSILTIPLILAGIIKYVERILCLELTNSKKTKSVIANSYHKRGFERVRFVENLLKECPESKIVLLGYLLFSVMRPDANDYLSGNLYLQSYVKRIKTYLRPTEFNHESLMLADLLQTAELRETPFDIAAAEMGFIFDTVYSKTSLIYTNKGCILRLISFTCSFSVLLFFLISIMNEPNFHFSSVDIHITITLLVGVVVLEFFAVCSMFSSHWTIPLMLFHESRWVRYILWYIFKYFPRSLFPRRYRKSGRMGQFNLLEYYWNSSNSKVYGFLETCFSNRILEYLHKYNYTKFVEVPRCLKLTADYRVHLNSFFKDDLSFEPTRGEKMLDKIKEKATFGARQYTNLKESIELDFDTSIIVWHLATSICYHQDVQHPYRNILIEDRKSSKYLSDYMMYLLALQPNMLLPENCRSFWLDACNMLKDLFSEEADMDHALKLLLNQNAPYAWYNISTKMAEKRKKKLYSTMEDPLSDLLRYALKLVTVLNSRQICDRWKMIKEMWMEMLLYAAHSCQQANHIKQLAQSDHEFLTLIWIMGGSYFLETLISLNMILPK
ncbi:hypothetical protein SLEP1_g27862 [Rubroshorea leprosula]|uniref:DUF4220 domain-containing protein n=1 Tax=Rubroshorea leprosula TaxID=152421 RepID=A0AAV5K137_9ROSI|nr:hypothetical protein SLEP1_g27862 [Rubroshorea leprosula]